MRQGRGFAPPTVRRSARPLIATPPPKSWIHHPLTRIAVVVAILLLAYFRWLPMPWRQPAVALLAMLWIRVETGGLAAMGLRSPVSARGTLGWSLLAALIVIGLVTPFVEPLLNALTGTQADYSGYGALVGNLPAALSLIGKAMVSAAIGEELIYRGFLLHQLSALFGGGRVASLAAVAVGGAVFGLAHAGQGLVGVLLTGITGALFGALYFASGRNLWAMILAHALVDIWGVGTLYFGWF